jgi:hypothetical protein
VINESPIALQLRYLQTLTHISAEKNSTIVFPIPGKLAFHLSENFHYFFSFSRTFKINEKSKRKRGLKRILIFHHIFFTFVIYS